MPRVGAASLVAHLGHRGEVHRWRRWLACFLLRRFRVLGFSPRVSRRDLHGPGHDARHRDSRLAASPLANRSARTPPGKCGGGMCWRGGPFGRRGRGGRCRGCSSKRGGGARRATRRRRALRGCQDSSTTRAASRHAACRRGSVEALSCLACAWVSIAWPVHAWVAACRVSSAPRGRLDSASSAVCASRLQAWRGPDSESDPPGPRLLFSPAVAHGRLSLPAVSRLAGLGTSDWGNADTATDQVV